MKTVKKDVYLTIDQFNKDLEKCLNIIKYPSKKNPYYVCEYISHSLYKSIVNIYITNN